MTKRMLILLACVILLTVVGCGSSEYIDDNPRAIVPMVEGNHWVVQRSNYADLDTLRYIPTDVAGPDGLTDWYIINWSSFNFTSMFAKITSIGLVHSQNNMQDVTVDYFGQQINQEVNAKLAHSRFEQRWWTYTYAKYPIRKGERWLMIEDISYYLSEEEEILVDFYVECISLNREVITQAGIFNCIVYSQSVEPQDPDIEIEDFPRYYYYAVGVGLVLIEDTNNDQELETTYELVDYHIED